MSYNYNIDSFRKITETWLFINFYFDMNFDSAERGRHNNAREDFQSERIPLLSSVDSKGEAL